MQLLLLLPFTPNKVLVEELTSKTPPPQSPHAPFSQALFLTCVRPLVPLELALKDKFLVAELTLQHAASLDVQLGVGQEVLIGRELHVAHRALGQVSGLVGALVCRKVGRLREASPALLTGIGFLT